ncbi:MAG TPA: hypothetical protein VIU64_01220 [Polyangia bacterium]
MKRLWLVLSGAASLVGFSSGCGPMEETSSDDLEQVAGAVSSKDFDVDFSGCHEFAGIGSIPKANARPLVPARFDLAPGSGANSAVIVVRVSDCNGVAVDGKKPKAARVSQIGISLTGAGTDPTAYINNYTLWYATDLGLLHAKLTGIGVDADVDQGITFQLSPNSCTTGNLKVGASPPHGPAFTACGTTTAPPADPQLFIANWVQDTTTGTVAMRTEFPAIQFGDSHMTLTTPPGSALANLIGGTTLTFPFLDSHNTFATAHMTVRQQ